MIEELKLAEAEYFYGQMLSVQETRAPFVYNLSAFLTAARSALQYALEDAKRKPGGQTWYDAAVAAQPSIKFLREKRNVNIHAAPVETANTYEVKLSDDLRIVDQVEVKVVRAGEVIPMSGRRRCWPLRRRARRRPRASRCITVLRTGQAARM